MQRRDNAQVIHSNRKRRRQRLKQVLLLLCASSFAGIGAASSAQAQSGASSSDRIVLPPYIPGQTRPVLVINGIESARTGSQKPAQANSWVSAEASSPPHSQAQTTTLVAQQNRPVPPPNPGSDVRRPAPMQRPPKAPSPQTARAKDVQEGTALLRVRPAPNKQRLSTPPVPVRPQKPMMAPPAAPPMHDDHDHHDHDDHAHEPHDHDHSAHAHAHEPHGHGVGSIFVPSPPHSPTMSIEQLDQLMSSEIVQKMLALKEENLELR
ncbi:MAG: hypothetical protein AAGG44_16640, partial [Planctomycetota bacterium]